MGGYGKTVQNLSGALNQEGAGEIADVLITLPAPRGGHIRRYHRANVIFEGQPPFGDKVGSLRSATSRASYVWLLQRRVIDVLLTIEYYRPYEHFMNELPTTPVVIWLHDPRPMSDWEKIATMSLQRRRSEGREARRRGGNPEVAGTGAREVEGHRP